MDDQTFMLLVGLFFIVLPAAAYGVVSGEIVFQMFRRSTPPLGRFLACVLAGAAWWLSSVLLLGFLARQPHPGDDMGYWMWESTFVLIGTPVAIVAASWYLAWRQSREEKRSVV